MEPSAMEWRAGREVICMTSRFLCAADENNSEAAPLKTPNIPWKAVIIQDMGAIVTIK